MQSLRQHRQRWLLALVPLLAAGCLAEEPVATAAPGDDGVTATATSSTEVPRTTGIPTMQPTPAGDLGIVVDPAGRPYDNAWGSAGSWAETRFLARLPMIDGRAEVVDGDALYGPLPVTVDQTESVRFRDTEELELRVVWQQRRAADASSRAADGPEEPTEPVRWYPVGDGSDPDVVEAILGVQLSMPGAEVARWGPFEPAYDTRAGIGAVTSRSLLAWADRSVEFGQPILDIRPPADRAWVLPDIDGVPGADAFVFDNGGGSGAYVLTEGFDEDDRLVAVVLWHPRFPWRLAFDQGQPPPDVTEREGELIDCIEGRRLISRWGRCT